MPRVLNTKGLVVTKSAQAFEAYDVIRHSEAQPNASVLLKVTGGGTLNLVGELGSRSAEVAVKDKGLTLATGSGRDTLRGGAQKDTLDGGAGDDLLVGGGGHDLLKGGSGRDLIWGGEGDDKLSGGKGDDAFLLTGVANGADLFRGGEGTDTLVISEATRVSRLILDGAASIERIDFEFGALSGTSGKDVFNLSGVLSGVKTYTSYGEIRLRGDDDSFVGTQLADVVHGEGGRDTLRGGKGNDRISGGSGDDSLHGGDGDDTFVLSRGANGVDLFRGSAGTDTLVVEDGDFTALSRLTLDAAASVERIGSDLYGTAGGDRFDLSGVRTYVGHVWIELGDGHDSFVGSRTGDTVDGGRGDDTLKGGAGNDALRGGDGRDELFGEDGDDTFLLDEGWNDMGLIRGGSGTDTASLRGSSPMSRLTLDDAVSVERVTSDYMSGTAGNDRFDLSGVTIFEGGWITFGAGDDIFLGSQAADRASAEDGNDTLYGGIGNDQLHGNAGNDRLIGGKGNDVLTGGFDEDVFVFNSAPGTSGGVDTVLDFTLMVDRFEIDDDAFVGLRRGLLGGLDDGAFVVGTAATAANHQIVYDADRGSLYFDPDGVGGAAQVHFASLAIGPGLPISASDFFVV